VAASFLIFTGESQDSTDHYSFRSEHVQSNVRNNYVISFIAKKSYSLLCMYVCMYVCMLVGIVCVCMYVYMYVCVCVCVCMFVCMCVYV